MTRSPALPTLAVIALLVACGSSSSTNAVDADGGADASSSSDADMTDAAQDAAFADVATDAPNGDAGSCATAGTASKCITCCRDAFPGAGIELVFFQECELCGAFCSGKAPCGGNGALAADAGCVACLSPKLGPAASGWTQCQQSAICKGFVACFATCPM